jgi:lipopolysaccharide transport system ATP-binding protein
MTSKHKPFISITKGVVEGIDTIKRAHGLKHFFLGGGELISQQIPILNGINFTCQEGERIAFIGHNGSGKSSLLKTIAGIYPLKTGELYVSGDIAAIIEMGIGFEPEMTGRANIKLCMLFNKMLDKYNPELEQKIIEFSGLGEKINWPVKVYSSGMLARLAFSVCIFQEPEILLLDEVFATGDSEFIEKSKSAMQNKFKNVPIAILVSHQEDIILDMCNRAVLFESGRIVADGKPEEILNLYHKNI